jgi:hypothetical protein
MKKREHNKETWKGDIMKREQKHTRTIWICCKTALLAVGLGAAVAACDDRTDPTPPGSPPRPMTRVNHVFTAQLDTTVRPVAPPPGMM